MANPQQYFIELAYDGTRYHGWQMQPNAVTVQKLLNKALATVLRCEVETTGCGRTDAGVHAKEFFAHASFTQSIADSPLIMDEFPITPVIDHFPATHRRLSTIDYGLSTKFVRSLNALLPHDIAIKSIIPLHADAHARFDATLRSYEYHIHFEKDPFLTNYSWQLRDKPDVALMNQAAAILMEYTDFSCFSKSNTQVKTNNCKISNAEWVENDGKLVFHISADRFLRNMVRAIVGTMLMVGKGEIHPEGIRQIIQSKNRSNAGTSVPACGLYLTEVRYPYLRA